MAWLTQTSNEVTSTVKVLSVKFTVIRIFTLFVLVCFVIIWTQNHSTCVQTIFRKEVEVVYFFVYFNSGKRKRKKVQYVKEKIT